MKMQNKIDMTMGEMCIVHWVCGKTRRDRVRNVDIRTKAEVSDC